ncbi:MAG TPA: mechanosensitive ion channel family protein [Chthoniobacteraceae bacterium]|nr:mechanosensitive ion channel family protein [Chthoniobacteraceae bacterium]
MTLTEKLLIFAIVMPVIFWLTIALGRFLKRGTGVKLGAMYSLFSVAISIYLPLKILGLDTHFESFDLRRELRAATIVLSAFFITALIQRYIWEGYFHKKRGTDIPKFIHELVALVIIALALTIVLGGIYKEGQALAGLLAGSGLVAIILGFAMQDLLGNIISGIALEVGKPFKRGDWLVYENQRAEVIEVNWRSTRLRNNDDVYLDIPNNLIVKHALLNLSYPNKVHAERIQVGIDYNIPPNVVREVLRRAAINGYCVLPNPVPKVFLKDYADSAVIYELKFWFDRDDQYNDIMDSVRTNIWYELNRSGIGIPFPIRTVKIERRPPAPHSLAPLVLGTLRKQKFFQCMDDAQIDRMLASAKLLRYGRGEKLINQGDEGDSMFVLVNGTVDVHVNHEGMLTYVTTLKTGDYFGEMSLLTGEKRSATVIANNDCEALKVDKTSFAEVLLSNPDLLQKLSEMLARRRLETEGVLASTSEKKTIETKEQEYTANFLEKLSSFFKL